jgi:hypothetical protein
VVNVTRAPGQSIEPILIDGIALGVINLGFSWPKSDAAHKDAQSYTE